jgi:hypothetical protein
MRGGIFSWLLENLVELHERAFCRFARALVGRVLPYLVQRGPGTLEVLVHLGVGLESALHSTHSGGTANS